MQFYTEILHFGFTLCSANSYKNISTVSHSFLSSSGFGAIGYLKDNAHIMVLGFQA